MLDPNLQSIISKAYAKIGDISYAIALKMKIGKNTLPVQRTLFEQGIKMSIILKILTRQIKFDSVTNIPTLYRLTELQVNRLVRCLVKLGDLNKYPVVPSLLPNVTPVILNQGLQGNPGVGTKGDKGDPGIATDFSISNANTTVIVDSFPITDANAAEWQYIVTSNTGKQRASSVIGHWTADGLYKTEADTGADDLLGSTTGLIEFNVNISGATVQLVATIISETWSIKGSREYIPRNGNGTGIINNVLPYGQFYIGNISNQAQAFSITGDVTFSPTGVASITANSILDADINSVANITLSKLASLNNNIVPITNGFGKLISSTLSPTVLGYVDIGSSLTGLLNLKLTDPLTTIGDLMHRNGSNITTRLPIGSPGQVLTVSGSVPSWQTPASGFADPMTSIGDLIIRNGANVTSRLEIGSTNQVLTVVGGVPTWAASASGFTDPMTTVGDIIIRNGSNVSTRLGIGTSSQVLTVTGGVPTWTNIPNQITGLTNNRIVLGLTATTVQDSSLLTWNNINKTLTTDLTSIASPGNNLYIGFQVGTINSTPQLNVIVGRSSGGGISSGDYNTFVGTAIANSLSSGDNNTFIGQSAGNGLTTGSGNTGIGVGAIGSVSVNGENTAIGFNALSGATGGANIGIGAYAGQNITGGVRNVVIGHSSGVPTPANGDQLSIVNAIYGINNNASGASISAGNIGLYVQVPTARLHLPAGGTVAGTAALKLTTGNLLSVVENGVFEYNGTNLYFTIGGVRKIVSLI
jgi:hypothetical protein